MKQVLLEKTEENKENTQDKTLFPCTYLNDCKTTSLVQ